jgi:hypothetical protein
MRRMRAARPTIFVDLQNRGAGRPHPALRATLSRRERAVTNLTSLACSHIRYTISISAIRFLYLISCGGQNNVLGFPL